MSGMIALQLFILVGWMAIGTSLPIKKSSASSQEKMKNLTLSERLSNASRENVVDQAQIMITGLEEGMRVIKKLTLNKEYQGPGKIAFQEIENESSAYRERLFKKTILERPISAQLKGIGSAAAYDYQLLFRIDFTLRELHNVLSHLQAANGPFAEIYGNLSKSMDRRTMEVRLVLRLVMHFCIHQNFPLNFRVPSEVHNRLAPKYSNHIELDVASYFILDDVKSIMTFIIDSFRSMPSKP